MRRLLAAFAVFGLAGVTWAGDVAIVTSAQGRIMRVGNETRSPLQAFDRIREGDRLQLDGDARLRLLYFDNGRLETWLGPMDLGVTAQGSEAGGNAAAVRKLNVATARQIARMPDPASPLRATGRTRSIPTEESLSRLEAGYKDLLASRSDADDLSAEIFLLSGLYELRAFDRLERVTVELQQTRPKNPEAVLLVSLYRKALKNARESGR